MTCYSPLIRIAKDFKWCDTSITLKIVGPSDYGGEEHFYEFYNSMEHYIREHFPQKEWKNLVYQRIPCGKCRGCRLDYSKEWATRCTLEASMWNHNWFVTMTYDEEHKPYKDEFTDDKGITWTDPGTWNGYLKPIDVMLFHKRLRQHLSRHFNHEGYRFYYCGEYGETYERPHYHELMFNMPIDCRDLKYLRMSKSGFPIFECKWLSDTWGKGLVTVQEYHWSAAAYTARYIMKKQTGDYSSEYYAMRGQTPEMVNMSRMPGIARMFYEQHKNEIYDLDEIIMKVGKDTVKSLKPPKYYDRCYDIDYPEDMARIKKIRQDNANEAEKLKMSKTSLTLLKQLQLEERNLEARTKILKKTEF